MGQIKWYKRDPAAALIEMQMLSLEERGAYTTLLELWRLRSSRLADDDRANARAIGIETRVWKRLKASLRESNFISIKDGCLLPEHTFEFYQERQAIPLPVRRQVIERDGDKCRYCGDTSGPFEFDHVLPWSRGGQDTVENLVRACKVCNRAKSDRTPEEMGWTL